MPAQWAEVIEQYARSLTAGGSSKTTIRLRRQQIQRFALDAGVGPWQATAADLEAHLGTPGWKPNTRASVRAGLRRFYSWAVAVGHIKHKANPSRTLPRVRQSPPHPWQRA